jgi:hypothetical protein
MTARLLLSQEPVSFWWVMRRVLAAAITAALVGYAITDHIESPGLRMGVVGAAGYAAPECLDFLMRWIKERGEKEVSAVSGKKPHGKSKAPAKGKRKR